MIKKLLVCLLLCLSLYSVAQERDMIVHTPLNYLVDDFVAEGNKRSFAVLGYLIDHVDGIYFYNVAASTLDANNLGVVSDDYRTIYLNENLKDNPLLLKITFYHEIGHALNRTPRHICKQCPEIMGVYAMDDLSAFEDEEQWQEMLHRYFKWIDEE
jgi:hypothetical protein